MTYLKRKQCEGCIRPVARRLGLFQANDDFECYAEGYVKCFWGMCDQHKSIDNFASSMSNGKVITTQPKPFRTEMPMKSPAIIKDIVGKI